MSDLLVAPIQDALRAAFQAGPLAAWQPLGTLPRLVIMPMGEHLGFVPFSALELSGPPPNAAFEPLLSFFDLSFDTGPRSHYERATLVNWPTVELDRGLVVAHAFRSVRLIQEKKNRRRSICALLGWQFFF